MANFIAGWTYANRNTLLYGTNKGTVATNKQFPTTPEINWVCQSVTKTFATFLDNQKVFRRCKVYTDILGKFVYPFGRYPQCPVLRAEYAYNNGTLTPDNDGDGAY
jgi:hypothetical protein